MKYLVEITSVLDREELVAEIWYKDQMIAEINQENEELELEIYFDRSQESLRLNYDALFMALKEGKEKLIGNPAGSHLK